MVAGRTAIITGGARGLGATYARALAASGAHVVIADVLEADGEALARGITEQHGLALFVATDVTRESDTVRLADHACSARSISW